MKKLILIFILPLFLMKCDNKSSNSSSNFEYNLNGTLMNNTDIKLLKKDNNYLLNLTNLEFDRIYNFSIIPKNKFIKTKSLLFKTYPNINIPKSTFLKMNNSLNYEKSTTNSRQRLNTTSSRFLNTFSDTTLKTFTVEKMNNHTITNPSTIQKYTKISPSNPILCVSTLFYPIWKC